MVPDEDAGCLVYAPLPMELHEYRQFTYKRFTVNAHKCFSVYFTPMGLAGATPLPHVCIHMLLHRLGVHPVNHYQLSFKCHSKDHQNAHKHVLSKVGA